MTKTTRRGRKTSRAASVEGSPRVGGANPCRSCGGTLPPGARFCHRCGAPLDDAPGDDRRSRTRYLIGVYATAGLGTVGAVVVAVLLTYGGQGGQAPPAITTPATTGMPSAVDLSTMTPRQAADRLFNRVMMASERGDAEEAQRFAPMALAAYGRVTSLDLDARYHLGLLHLVLGDLDQTRGQIGLLKQNVPQHLLALLLEHAVATRSGDAAAAARVAAEFDAAYGAEMATARPEYEAHRLSIERFRAAAAPPEAGSAGGARTAAVGDGAVFERKCAGCHGRRAKGTERGPPLVHRIYEPGHHGDQSFYRAVRQGVRAHHWPFGDMPPVEGVSDEEIARIVAYVRGLQKAAGIE